MIDWAVLGVGGAGFMESGGTKHRQAGARQGLVWQQAIRVASNQAASHQAASHQAAGNQAVLKAMVT